MAQISTANEAVTGQPIPASHVDNLVLDVTELYNIAKTALGDGTGVPLFTLSAGAHLVTELHHFNSAFTFGTAPVTSAGYFIFKGAPGLSYNPSYPGNQQTYQVSSAFTTAAQCLNELFLMPAHGALSVKKVSGLLRYSGTPPSGNTVAITAVSVLVVKISAAGTETTLKTVTASAAVGGIATPAPGGFIEVPFSGDFTGAVATLVAGERLGLRIQTTAQVGSGGVSGTITMNQGPPTGGFPLPPMVSTVAWLFA